MYAVSGTVLNRDIDGEDMALSRNINEVVFARSGQVLTMGVAVNASKGTTARRTLTAFLRKLKQ